MKHVKNSLATAFVSVACLVVVCGQAAAFNPQPEPQGIWRIEGFIDMFATAIEPGNSEPPFGIDPAIASDGQVDFSAGMIAMFDAPDIGADGKPDDGLYAGDVAYFRVQIGDTSWDETMPSTGFEFQVEGGLVTGASVVITGTMPSHPDLSFMMPSSPGTWEALDERGDHNAGSILGTYTLRDGIVPEPATLGLLLGGLALLKRRR